MEKQSMDQYPPVFRDAIRFHGHVCPGLIIGYRAAKVAQSAFRVERSEDEELVAIVENDAAVWTPFKSSSVVHLERATSSIGIMANRSTRLFPENPIELFGSPSSPLFSAGLPKQKPFSKKPRKMMLPRRNENLWTSFGRNVWRNFSKWMRRPFLRSNTFKSMCRKKHESSSR